MFNRLRGYYFSLYNVIKNAYISFSNADTRKRYVPSVMAASALTVLLTSNLKFILPYVYPDPPQCHYDCLNSQRQGLVVVSSVGLMLLNMYIFRNQNQDQVDLGNHERGLNIIVLVYALISLTVWLNPRY